MLFSAHSLPKRQIESGDSYEQELHATVDALKARLGAIPGGFQLAYQSKVGPVRWLGPNISEILKTLGGRDVIVVPISFVSEHIETLHELDILYRDLAEKCGIRTYLRVKTPGIDPRYLDCLFRRTLEALP